MRISDYFSKMVKTSEHVNPVIILATEQLKQHNPALHQFVTALPQFGKVYRKNKLRPFLLRLAYEVAGGDDWTVSIPACAASELLNISTYIDNAVLDAKGAIDDSIIGNSIVTGRLVRNLATRLMRECYNDGRLDNLLEDIDYHVYLGQYADLNNFGHEEVMSLTLDAFLERYVERCSWLTGRFMENISKMGAVLAGVPEKKIGEFGKNMGVIVQIMNDVGDFVPPDRWAGCDAEKTCSDQYADMRRGKVMLPLYYALTHCSEGEKDYLLGVLSGAYSATDEVTKIIVRSGAIDRTRTFAREYANRAKKAIHSFDKSESRDFLSLMTQMYAKNKYLTVLRGYK